MHQMVMLVLSDTERYHDILDAWEATGVKGVTVLASTGLGRTRRAVAGEGFPLMPSLLDFLRTPEQHHHTLFTVVEGDEMVDTLVAATEQILKDLSRPDSGVIFVLPVTRAIGLRSDGDNG